MHDATHPILWDITGTSKEFDLDYSVNGGLTWKRIVSNYYTLTGEYDWPVPDEASEEALVRVTDSENGEVVDVSDAVFTILAAVPTVKWLHPNGGKSPGTRVRRTRSFSGPLAFLESTSVCCADVLLGRRFYVGWTWPAPSNTMVSTSGCLPSTPSTERTG